MWKPVALEDVTDDLIRTVDRVRHPISQILRGAILPECGSSDPKRLRADNGVTRSMATRNGVCFLPLEFVHGSYPRSCGKPLCKRRDLRVVRSDNEDVRKPEGMDLAVFDRPSHPGSQ